MKTHPLALVSLCASLAAYASAFIGNAALVLPAIGVAAIAVLAGVYAWYTIHTRKDEFGGTAFAAAGVVSGAVFILLGSLLMRMSPAAA